MYEMANESLLDQLHSFYPDKNDPVVKTLTSIFGDLGGFGGFTDAANSATLVSQMFINFNVLLMALTSAWLVWLFSKGLLNSAHDGEFLGKKYHSAWVPLRTAIGVITIMPMPFLGGWNLAQAFYGMCILIGTGIGNGVASSAVNYIDVTSKRGVDVQVMPNFDFFYTAVIDAQNNLLTLQNKEIQRFQNEQGLDADGVALPDVQKMDLGGYQQKRFAVSVGQPGQGMFVRFGAVPSDADAHYGEVMQSIDLSLGATKSSKDLDLKNFSAAVAAINAIALSTYVSEVQAAYAAAIGTKIQGYACTAITGACTMYAHKYDTNSKGLQPAQTDYTARKDALVNATLEAKAKANNTIRAAIKDTALPALNAATLESNKAFLQTKSWFGLGMILPKAASRSAAAQHQVTNSTAQAGGSTSEVVSQVKPDGSIVDTIVKGLMKVVNPMSGVWEAAAAEVKPEKSLAGEIYSIFEEGGLNRYFMRKISSNKNGFEGYLLSASGSGEGTGGAISGMIALGQNLISIASTLVVAILSLVVIAGAAAIAGSFVTSSFFSVVSGAMSILAALIGPLVILLYGAGISLSVILPYMPMMYWLAIIASMLFVYVEAILAAPLWAFAHLEDEGDGMGQKAQKGYVFIFALLFGPAILVISYTVCMQIFEILSSMGSKFISAGIVEMLGDSQSLLETIAMMLGAAAVIFSMHYMLIKICFGAPVTVLSKVLNMIGGEWGSNVVGEGATSAVGDAEQRGKVGSAAAMGLGAGMIGGLASGKLAGNGGSSKGKSSKDDFTEKSQKEVGDQLAGMADAAKSRPDSTPAVTTAQDGQAAQQAQSAQTAQATPDAATTPDAQSASTTETADKQASIASLGDTANTKEQAKASTPAPAQASSLADAQTAKGGSGMTINKSDTEQAAKRMDTADEKNPSVGYSAEKLVSGSETAKHGQHEANKAKVLEAKAESNQAVFKTHSNPEAAEGAKNPTGHDLAKAKSTESAQTQATPAPAASTPAPAPAPAVTPAPAQAATTATDSAKAKTVEAPKPVDTDLAKPKADPKDKAEQKQEAMPTVGQALQAGLEAAAETARAAAKGLGAQVQEAPQKQSKNVDLAVRADDSNESL